MDPEDFLDETRQWIQCGFQVNAHAIGDRGNRVALDGYESAMDDLNIENKALLRLRIEHSQIVEPSDQIRFRDLGIVASMQPTHATSDMFFAPDRLGNRTADAYLWKTFLNLSVPLPFGSDFPVEKVDPLLGFYAAITRQNSLGQPAGGWFPEQRVNQNEALYAFTKTAAWVSFQEEIMGELSEGKFGDFVVLDRNIMEVEPQEVLESHVTFTFVGGTCVYERDLDKQNFI